MQFVNEAMYHIASILSALASADDTENVLGFEVDVTKLEKYGGSIWTTHEALWITILTIDKNNADSYSDEIILPFMAQRIACASRQQAEYLRLKRKYEKHINDKYSRKLEKLQEDYELAKDAYVRTLSKVVLDIASIFSQNNLSLNEGVRDAYQEHKETALRVRPNVQANVEEE